MGCKRENQEQKEILKIKKILINKGKTQENREKKTLKIMKTQKK